MKALCVFALLLTCSLAVRADDPYALASELLQQHHVEAAARAYTLVELESLALQGNPEIKLAARKVAAAEAGVSGAGALDDATAMYRGWQIPLRQPWNLNSALNMLMLTQSFPGPGKRALRSQVAGDEIAVAKAQLEATKRDVQARARKAFYDLLRNRDELRIHDEQVAIARQGVEAARIRYAVGRVPQQDVLKAQVALTKLIEHLVMLEQDAALARAELNSLLGRSPDTPIAVSGEYDLPAQLPALAELEKAALQSRPELLAAQAEIKRNEDQLKLANKGYTPDFSASVGYMLMPQGSSTRNTYMVEGALSLPWLNRRKHDAEIAEADSRLAVQQAAYETARTMALQQIQEALIKAASAKRLAELYQRALRPQSEATLRATVIAYENDRTDFLNLLDSQNTTLDVDFSYFRAIADFDARIADLELAVGAPIARSTSGAEVKQ